MSQSLSNCYFDLNLSLALLIPQAKGVPEEESSRGVPLKIKPTERRYVRVHPALDHPADDRNHVRSPARLWSGAANAALLEGREAAVGRDDRQSRRIVARDDEHHRHAHVVRHGLHFFHPTFAAVRLAAPREPGDALVRRVRYELVHSPCLLTAA